METEGTLEGVQAYAIHGTRYYRVYFSHLEDPETIRQAQLPFDAFDTTLKPGDPIAITYLLKTIMQIWRSKRDAS